MFQNIVEKPEGWTFTVEVSYLEIYNEKVYDLLEFKDSDLPIREDIQHNIFMPGLTEVRNAKHVCIIIPHRGNTCTEKSNPELNKKILWKKKSKESMEDGRNEM